MNPRFRTTLMLGACLTGLALTQVAFARERHGSVTGPRGQTATRDVSRSHGDVSVTTTGPGGKTVSRETERNRGDVDGSVTGPNGQTVTREVDRAPGSTSAVVTGPDGTPVWTRQTTRQR